MNVKTLFIIKRADLCFGSSVHIALCNTGYIAWWGYLAINPHSVHYYMWSVIHMTMIIYFPIPSSPVIFSPSFFSEVLCFSQRVLFLSFFWIFFNLLFFNPDSHTPQLDTGYTFWQIFLTHLNICLLLFNDNSTEKRSGLITGAW